MHENPPGPGYGGPPPGPAGPPAAPHAVPVPAPGQHVTPGVPAQPTAPAPLPAPLPAATGHEAIVATNAAVAGGAAAGIAATAGVAAGKAAPGVLAAIAGGAGTGAKTAAAKSAMGLTAMKVAAAAVGIAVLAGGVAVGVNAFGGGGFGSGSQGGGQFQDPVDASNDDIRGYDWANATFQGFGRADGGDSVTLHDGEADRYDEFSYTEMYGEPIYADLDGDHDTDAVTMLVTHGGNSEFTAMFVWLWQDGKAVQFPQAVASRVHCGDMFEDPVLADGRVTYTVQSRVGFNGGCAGAPEDFVATPVTLGVRDGFPVATAPALGAVHSCLMPLDASTVPVPEGAVPRVWPDMAAPALGEPADLSLVVGVDAQARPGWTVVRVSRADGYVSCGWVPTP